MNSIVLPQQDLPSPYITCNAVSALDLLDVALIPVAILDLVGLQECSWPIPFFAPTEPAPPNTMRLRSRSFRRP